MPTPSERPVSAVYDGRLCIGYIAVIGEGFHAETATGRSLGAFDTSREASAALTRAADARTHG